VIEHELDQQTITKIINNCKDGVDKSCFGPLFQYPDRSDITKRQVNQLALGIYTVVLQQILKNITFKVE